VIQSPRKHWKQIKKKDKLEWLRSHSSAGKYAGVYQADFARREFVEYRKRLPDIHTRECYVCDYIADEYHHIVYLSNGGVNTPRNIIPLCQGCHKKVHRHDPRRGNRKEQEAKFESPFSVPKESFVYIPPPNGLLTDDYLV
jgi:5-methylcytosine-specific restriction endonuclease McrA